MFLISDIDLLPGLPSQGKKLSIISSLPEKGMRINSIRYSKYLLPALFSFWSYITYSQTNCETPLPPVLITVSVQPETGKTDLNWTLSPSSDIAAYIVYTYKNGDAMPVDTLWNPLATNYTITSTATRYFSVAYVVAAFRLPGIPGMVGCPSELSNVLHTVFTGAAIDTCNKKIAISWNSYLPVPKKVTGYTILASVNGGSYIEAGNVSSDKNSFTLSDFSTDSEYCFVVRANLEGGAISTSNKACIITKMQRPPQWINADYATVNSANKITLSYTIDPVSQITHFSLGRKSGTTGVFQEIAQPVSNTGSVTFTDDKADIKVINYYRLSAINNCNNPVTISNISSNIVLSLEQTGNDLNLSWNSYKSWMGSIAAYSIFINTGEGFEEKAVLQSADTAFTLGYKEIMYEVTGDEVCFYISASEKSNPHGIQGQSHSSGTCIAPVEIITVPNVFTPNNDLVNDLFRPVLSFIPTDYQLVISDRQGKTLFESKDYSEAWDGSQNGNPQPQGVCLWFMKVTTPSGKSISKTGTVTIVSNR
jgi:gliding motility-associated-like protein